MRSSQIYLDHNATSPMLPGTLAAMEKAFAIPCNASSIHGFGRQAKHWINESQRKIAQAINAAPDEIVFTSGGTESNNMVLNAIPNMDLLLDPTGHDSLYKAAPHGIPLQVNQEGSINLDYLESKLLECSKNKKPCIVSIGLAHYETGVIQDIQAIQTLTKKYAALLHLDAVQALGKIPLCFQELGVNFLSLSAHKIGGPQGIGALVIKEGTPYSPHIKGGGQQKGRRSGTENVAGILGFAHAISNYPHPQAPQIHRDLEKRLATFCHHENLPFHIYGQGTKRLWNTTCIAMPGVPSHTQVMHFDLANIAISMGAACSSGRTEVSRSLRQMGPSEDLAKFAIRISSGWNTKEEDLLTFEKQWKKLYLNLRKDSIK